MPGGRGVVLVRFDEVPHEIEAGWNRWYDDTHIPAPLALPGFLAARRFKSALPLAPGPAEAAPDPQYLTLYDLAHRNAVESEWFLRDRDSPWAA